MKTLFQLAFLLLLSGTTIAQNNVNNPDPQNGEPGSNPAINTTTTEEPDHTVPYPNGYDYSQPQNPNRYENPNDSSSSTFNQFSGMIIGIHQHSQLATQFSKITVLSICILHRESDCTNCTGSGKCKWCDGSGSKTCVDCNGSGEEGTLKNADGTTTYLKCYRCSGRGSYNCNFCSTSGKCSFCNGTGDSPYHAAIHIAPMTQMQI